MNFNELSSDKLLASTRVISSGILERVGYINWLNDNMIIVKRLNFVIAGFFFVIRTNISPTLNKLPPIMFNPLSYDEINQC